MFEAFLSLNLFQSKFEVNSFPCEKCEWPDDSRIVADEDSHETGGS